MLDLKTFRQTGHCSYKKKKKKKTLTKLEIGILYITTETTEK